MTSIYDKASDAIREDGQQLARSVLQHATNNPAIALAILGVAASTVLDAVPDHDERAALLDEFIEALEDAP